jgi:VWFA-related protein
MKRAFTSMLLLFGLLVVVQQTKSVSEFTVEKNLENESEIRVVNLHGKISFQTDSALRVPVLKATSRESISDSEISVSSRQARAVVEVSPSRRAKRIDIQIRVPEGRRVSAETADGEISFAGAFSTLTARSSTGSILTDVPLTGNSYRFVWSGSRPRIVSDAPLERTRERTGGRFEISGRFPMTPVSNGTAVATASPSRMEFITERGVILVNVALSDAPSEVRDRPLSDLAKSIIMTGDSVLTEAIRRGAPQAFAEFSSNLRGRRTAPALSRGDDGPRVVSDALVIQVVDSDNRAVSGLKPDEFEIFIGDKKVEIESVSNESTPFDVVLLIDVSGSVDDYLDFVRRAAGSFLETTSSRDRVAVYSFNEGLKRLSDFSTDRSSLAAVLFDLEAGGGTALYDSLGFILADTMRRARSDRTAVIILSDGDDNKSFVNFNSLTGVIEETNTLIYPLYVPSGLALASRLDSRESSIDPSRARFMTLTSKADSEGERLAALSGGVYYPIKRVEEIQQAYDDIVARLRTSYTLTFKRAPNADQSLRTGRVRVNVKREDVTVTFRGAPAVLGR